MANYTRTLKISTSAGDNNLGQEATLVLVFDKFNGAMNGPYETIFPLVWKATKFGAEGRYNLEVTYSSQLASIKPGKNRQYEFTNAVPLEGAHDARPKVVNESGSAESIAIGFVSAEKADEAIRHRPTFYAQITPISTGTIFENTYWKTYMGLEGDLGGFEDDTTWNLKYEYNEGFRRYAIT
ncbi:hypothetical protein PAXRUDRAFT_31575 [Paxillus rubicundulus Ve08.2h10]|uniref:Uncharacterized protein n=1 Tax=Paxillus rubicundulus Ve08.2h10 TaxID=930991 RepID=A0A0D0E7M0_9AGAM|nr:hypothetical protein PAXRUDRAFT_31575 [Paxillus rubicundulus Ve08.2h10]